jgi:hypothetical protein
MVQGDDRTDRFLEQALRFEEAAKNARDPDLRRVYEELAQLWRSLLSRSGRFASAPNKPQYTAQRTRPKFARGRANPVPQKD